MVLGVSVLHYSTRSWDFEGIQTAASAHALHQPTIVASKYFYNQCLEVQKLIPELSVALIEMSIEFNNKA